MIADQGRTPYAAPVTGSGVRLAELMAALSMATDLGMGQPLETALSSCVVAMRLGEALGLDASTLRTAYYYALLRYIGCNAHSDAMAALFGDELALRRDFAAVDSGDIPQVLELAARYIRQANADEPPERAAAIVASALRELPGFMRESFAGHCEVAQRLARRMGLDASVIRCLGQVYERWDGHGLPRGLKGEAVDPAVLLVALAQVPSSGTASADPRRRRRRSPGAAAVRIDRTWRNVFAITRRFSWQTSTGSRPSIPCWPWSRAGSAR
jgi:hypothetical protein